MTKYILERYKQYALLMRLNKPIGIFLLLWPTLWALWIAGEGHPDSLILIVFIAGVILMRSAGCVINDIADRKLDTQVKRTEKRPIASGQIKVKDALTLFTALCLIAFFLVLYMNTLTILLSIGGLALGIIYPYTKRYTYLPQIFLGLTFGWAVPMAFAAQTGEIPKEAWLLLISTVLWATAYDTMYAMMDRPDDIKAGIKSTAILFGNADRFIIGIIQITMLLVMVLVGQQLELSSFYYMGLVTAAGLALYQQALLKERDPALYFKAFLNNNWFGAAIFVGLYLHYLLI
ncbi:MAG: 4-hydroxybenzoate octaprenyltransferase [Gammaproteobacteria bacterium]|nr:4-hydroxybenzoate octaprenyltransferase [Gammaproteobacteria bacterium]